MNVSGETAYAMEGTPKFEKRKEDHVFRSDLAPGNKRGLVSISPMVESKKYQKLRNQRGYNTNLAIDGKQLTSAIQMPTSLALRTKSPILRSQPQIEVDVADLLGPINIPFINGVNVNVHKVPNA